ncbi:hypothetical protein ALNOE001_06540 [Candidatus Methanobinarius endosymbioticus]|uniref:Uncharacterized protein n=1 Tax=Candidatus Methanobinarius endosymbioticus TaxID=2006182 RepID=A0A366MEG8_9EURY|nr:hypothetical protein ALNOE001_06540 [Candidatus Methanobinarius endosymbioticus]
MELDKTFVGTLAEEMKSFNKNSKPYNSAATNKAKTNKTKETSVDAEFRKKDDNNNIDMVAEEGLKQIQARLKDKKLFQNKENITNELDIMIKEELIEQDMKNHILDIIQ